MTAAAWRAGFAAASGAPLMQNWARQALALAGIALGVALGTAVHLINASTLAEFEHAVYALAGEADVVVRGPRAGFSEDLYPRIARLPEVEAADPAIETDAPLAERRDTLKIVGLDPFRALELQPALIGEPVERNGDFFGARSVLLSRSAATALGVKPGATIGVRTGSAVVPLTVVGLLPENGYRPWLGIMDIASAQWTFGRLGTINRIDLRLRPGVDIHDFRERLQRMLPAGLQASTPALEADRGASLTRAYRVNLDMLALIALMTGGFLVFATQYLALTRRRAQLALLRALGVTRGSLVAMLLAEGALIGALGSALGVALGIALAELGVARFGGDLGAGYFGTLAPQLVLAPAPLALFFALGVVAALLGALAPARDAALRPPALALKAGDELADPRSHRVAPGLALLAAGSSLAFAPPVAGLPVLGYAAITLLLLGTVLVTPRVVALVLQQLPRARSVPWSLAAAQLAGTPRLAAVSIASIVVSFSLMIAMLIMVTSFRDSLGAWLSRMLPADLYARAAPGGETGYFSPIEQQLIVTTPGIARAEFVRSQNLLIAPDRPPLVLLARAIDEEDAGRRLPLVSPAVARGPGAPPPVWVSEIAADLYHWRAGDEIELSIGPQPRTFTIAGIWRDYARQSGAIAIERGRYAALTGDSRANDAAVWLAPGASIESVAGALRDRLAGAEGVEITASGELRAASLRIFDRTFAVTYALEAAAVLIGLLGVSVSFSHQALARRREFGVLRHVGMTRREVAAMLALEGALAAAIGAAVGLALGWAESLILVHVVNRQSFHWSMDLSTPWAALAAVTATLIAAAAVTAAVSGSAATSGDAINAVREDW